MADAKLGEVAFDHGEHGAQGSLTHDRQPLAFKEREELAAVLLDLGFPASTVKSVPILARTASLLAHLAEEREQPIGFLLASNAEEAITYEPAEEPGA